MKIALTYNLKEDDQTKPTDYFSEFDSPDTINAIISALENKGHTVEPINVKSTNLFSYFKNNRVDIVFNIAEGRNGKFREAELPAVLDYLNIPYTGSNPFAMGLALNKGLTKKILKSENIPTPSFQIFKKLNEELNPHLKFPLIVKPNLEGSSKGISLSSVVHDKDSLYRQIKDTQSLYKQEVIIEEFIEGKELSVGILENGKCKILPILEIDFSPCVKSGEYFYSWRMKEYQGDVELGFLPRMHCPAQLDKETEDVVKRIAWKTHQLVGCFDFSRTDIRLSKDNIPYVLEINPLPGLNPKESNFPLMAYAAGMNYDDLIGAILTNASERIGLN